MNAAIAEWCAKFSKGPMKILYLPDGPYQVGQCEPARYDVIVTRCKPQRPEIYFVKDFLTCLWRLGYEFATPDCTLLLIFEGWPDGVSPDKELGMPDSCWCRWDTMDDGTVGIFKWVQRLAPWVSTQDVWRMSPSRTVMSDHV